jgi:hypothetical protein
MPGEQPGRARTRDLHEMRRADRSGAQDHFAASTDVDDPVVFQQLHAGGAVRSRGPDTASLILVDLVIHQHTKCLGLGVYREVGAVGDWMQERIGHRPAPPAPLVDVKVCAAGVVASVELLDRLDAQLGNGGLPGIEDPPAHPWPFNTDLSTGAVPLVGAPK